MQNVQMKSGNIAAMPKQFDIMTHHDKQHLSDIIVHWVKCARILFYVYTFLSYVEQSISYISLQCLIEEKQ